MRFGRRVLFRGLSLSLEGGESLAIVGPNGSGKSTLLQILGGLRAPWAGRLELSVGGRYVARLDHPLHVGIVAPYVNLYGALSAAENLRFLARLRGFRNHESNVHSELAAVGLGHRADDLVATFSSGMVQRLRIAAASLFEPALLLLDEPSTMLDEAGLHLVEGCVVAAARRGAIVLLATNVRDEARRCDRTCDVTSFR